MHYNNILVTTDFSELSKQAFDVAAYHAKTEECRITLIHVLESFHIPPELQKVIWTPGQVKSMEKNYLEAATKELEEIANTCFHGESVETVCLLSEHPPGTEIANYAKEHNCDLIVMASSGRGSMSQLLLGSTVQKILSASSCSVLIVPSAKK